MTVFEGVVGVNMESKYDAPDRRIKFEDNSTWFGAPESMSDDLGRGFKVKVKTEGSGNDARITKVKVLERSKPKPSGGNRRGGGGGGRSQMSKEEWAAKDRTIQYQHAQKVGVSLLELALETGALKLPAKGEKLNAFLTGYDQMVAYVFADIETQAAAKRVAGESEESDDMDDDVEDTDDGFGDEDGDDEDDF